MVLAPENSGNQTGLSSTGRSEEEASLIIARARQTAEQILRNAEELTRKEARQRYQKEIENMLRAARQQATDYQTRTIQAAKQEAREIIDTARKEAAILTQTAINENKEFKQRAAREIAENQNNFAKIMERTLSDVKKSAMEKAEKEAADIINKARAQAQRDREIILANAIAEAKRVTEIEVARLLDKARREAEQYLLSAKQKVRGQLAESNRCLQEINQKMRNVLDLDLHEEDKKAAIVPGPVPAEGKDLAAPKIHPFSPVESADLADLTERETRINILLSSLENQLYQGTIKLEIAAPYEVDQISKIEEKLAKVEGLHLIGKGPADAGGIWIEIKSERPLPLKDILGEIPEVKELVSCKNYLVVGLKVPDLGGY